MRSPLVGDVGLSRDLGRNPRNEFFHQRHHVVIVGKRLVELEHRELGVVKPAQPLVAEVLGYLVDTLEAAHDEPLQVEFVGDTQVESGVEGMVAGHERAGRRAPVERLQDGRLHLEEAVAVENPAHGGHDPRPGAKHLPHLRVDGEVGVTLAIPRLRVREAAVFHACSGPAVDFALAQRQRTQRLGKQRPGRDLHCHLAHACAEESAFHADPVAQIEQVQVLERLRSQEVLAEIHLDAA